MNPWFDYGFASGPVHPIVQPTYALQLSPAIAAYQRQPFVSPAVPIGMGSAAPYGVNQPTPFSNGPFGMFGGPGLSTGAWPGFQEPSTLRTIGFQPPIAGAGTLTQLPQLFGRIPSDDEVENLISEAVDSEPLFVGNVEVEVQCEAGVVTLTGNVPHKSIKHAIGELAWGAPGIADVKSNLELSGRWRIRAGLRKEAAPGPATAIADEMND
jgi:BON domain